MKIMCDDDSEYSDNENEWEICNDFGRYEELWCNACGKLGHSEGSGCDGFKDYI